MLPVTVHAKGARDWRVGGLFASILSLLVKRSQVHARPPRRQVSRSRAAGAQFPLISATCSKRGDGARVLLLRRDERDLPRHYHRCTERGRGLERPKEHDRCRRRPCRSGDRIQTARRVAGTSSLRPSLSNEQHQAARPVFLDASRNSQVSSERENSICPGGKLEGCPGGEGRLGIGLLLESFGGEGSLERSMVGR